MTEAIGEEVRPRDDPSPDLEKVRVKLIMGGYFPRLAKGEEEKTGSRSDRPSREKKHIVPCCAGKEGRLAGIVEWRSGKKWTGGAQGPTSRNTGLVAKGIRHRVRKEELSVSDRKEDRLGKKKGRLEITRKGKPNPHLL